MAVVAGVPTPITHDEDEELFQSIAECRSFKTQHASAKNSRFFSFMPDARAYDKGWACSAMVLEHYCTTFLGKDEGDMCQMMESAEEASAAPHF